MNTLRLRVFPFTFRLAALVVVLTFFPVSAEARCRMFDLEEELPKVPFVVRGVVTESVSSGELTACASLGRERCRYRFTIEIEEVLKGELSERRVTFEYGYWDGCPGVDTFRTGERRYFFLRRDNSVSSPVLYGNSCGFSGVPEEGDAAKRLLRLLRAKKR